MSGHETDTTSPSETPVKSPNGNSTTIQVRVPPPLLEAFRALAEREFDTVSGRIRLLMREDVRRNRSSV